MVPLGDGFVVLLVDEVEPAVGVVAERDVGVVVVVVSGAVIDGPC